MLLGWDVDKSEVKELDGHNPSVDGSTWLDVWIGKHAMHILHIHFNYKVSEANYVHLESM